MGKKSGLFFCVFVIAVLAMAAYFKIPAFQEILASVTEQDFREDNIYSDLKSVSERLDEEILKGTDSFIIYKRYGCE